MALVNEDRVKHWLKEEEERKSYSLQTVKEIMKEVFQTLSSFIVPLEKEAVAERLSNFDDINAWITTCKSFEEKIAAKNQEERNKLLDSWGISIQTFERSFDELSSNSELLSILENFKYELLSDTGDMTCEITADDYKSFLKDQLYYLKNHESDLDTLKQNPTPLRKQLIEARIADFAVRKNSISINDVRKFEKTNADKLEDPSIKQLKSEVSKSIAALFGIPSLDPLKTIIAVAKKQQETQGLISEDIVDSILEYIFESVNEKLVAATEQERKERRKNFESISVWVQTIQKYIKLAIELSDTELEKALRETCDDLSGDIWEKSLKLYEIDVTQRLDEFMLKKKMESAEKPKTVTKELYLQFLDVQLDYLKNRVGELEENGIRSLYLSERIQDYCAIKTGLEAEDVMIFAENNQDVLYEPVVMQKLFEIDTIMQKVTKVLDSKAKSSVDSDDDYDMSDRE